MGTERRNKLKLTLIESFEHSTKDDLQTIYSLWKRELTPSQIHQMIVLLSKELKNERQKSTMLNGEPI